MVDLKKKAVVVYDLERDDTPVIYGFDQKVPVRIFDEKCQVDFAEIEEYLNYLYGNEKEEEKK